MWLRLVTSALILAVACRPVLRGRSGTDWLVVLAFGATLALMNWAIYQSFARIPLGIAVTVEFIGPLTLAVLLSRRARDLVWVVLAALGVALLGLERADLDLVGVLFALLAGAAWAAYILLTVQTGRRWQGLDGLAMASVVATVLLTPVMTVGGGEGLGDSRILAIGALVGLLSSVIPYGCEMRRAADPFRIGPQHPDEPRARSGGARRDARGQRVSHRRAVDRGRVRRDGEHRRHPQHAGDERTTA